MREQCYVRLRGHERPGSFRQSDLGALEGRSCEDTDAQICLRNLGLRCWGGRGLEESRTPWRVARLQWVFTNSNLLCPGSTGLATLGGKQRSLPGGEGGKDGEQSGRSVVVWHCILGSE